MAEILRYPDDIIDSSTDYLRLEIIKYKPAGEEATDLGNISTGLSSLFDTKTGTSRAASRLSAAAAETTIILPIPGKIGDSNSAGWGEDRLNDAAAFGVGQIAKTVNSDSPTEALNVLKDTVTAAGGLWADLLVRTSLTTQKLLRLQVLQTFWALTHR